MLNGLDLFTGIAGLSRALSPWVRPKAYCENDRFAQGVILSRISDLQIPDAPIWDDVRTLKGSDLRFPIDIIYGGFPCQDISVAGNGAGLEGKRSGLVSEIFRLAEEIRPTFIFLENVPAIRTRGAERVCKTLASQGYDCRWDVISAAEVGAPHLRKRWFLLSKRRETMAHASGSRNRPEPNAMGSKVGERESLTAMPPSNCGAAMANTDEARLPIRLPGQKRTPSQPQSTATGSSWWAFEPDVGRVANGVPKRVDRIRGLGNAVVPLQARTAFERLMGLS